jgi:hydrogenase maturation protein HypF
MEFFPYRPEFFVEKSHLAKHLERLMSGVLIDLRYCEPNVDNRVISDTDVRQISEAHILFDTAEIDPAHTRAVGFEDAFHLTGNCKTHDAQIMTQSRSGGASKCTMENVLKRRRIDVSGIVQGVGFRPFIYNLACEHKLSGSVHNHSSGVRIEAEGDEEALAQFASDLLKRLPPLALIDEVISTEIACVGDSTFVIEASESAQFQSTPVPPDVATCEDCIRELFDPADRRFGYPFLNCTNCGPRFTIIRDLPYDRPATTMAAFQMCAACEAEYHDAGNRRFHAQPNACPVCGPRFEPGAVERARALLLEGAIVAVKGIGGFHLVCDALNDAAVGRLRERKSRFEQPFAVMARDLNVARGFAEVDAEEARLLLSRQRPIVLLRKRAFSRLSELVAPGNGYVGVMLPYAPVHYLILSDGPLVMTSANPSGEPIVRENQEALERLRGIAEAFLTHNRDIEVVCDDSVVRTFEGREMPLRRSRGYAPMPVRLPGEGGSVLAVGAELKSTFCVTKDHFAYLSQHIGDMGTLETQTAFERALDHMSRLFRVAPERVVCDLHPGYQSSHWAAEFAKRQGIELVKVQHHHAHVAVLVAESGLPLEAPLIGFVFDGTGYGTDGAIWGGEVLVVRGGEFERFAHLPYVPIAGGDASVKTPARTALSYLRAAGIAWDSDLPCVAAFTPAELRVLGRQMERGLNCVDSSSMGRLFDAVSSLIGVRQRVTYEGQAAIELESLCGDAQSRNYPWEALLPAIIADLRAGVPREEIAAGFHDAVARWVLETAGKARDHTGLNRVGLTGGVFQNITLLRRCVNLLRSAEFEVLIHRIVPANDGGLALGQAALGLCGGVDRAQPGMGEGARLL